MASLLFIVCLAAIVAGVALIYVPAAFIVGGSLGAVLTWWHDAAAARSEASA